MKYILLFATLLVAFACKKSKNVEPLDILPGNWELKEESLRTEPGGTIFRFRADKSFTRTSNGDVKSGTFEAHYVNDQKDIEMILTTDQGTAAGVFYLKMVTAHEFKYYYLSVGPGPSPKLVLVRAK